MRLNIYLERASTILRASKLYGDGGGKNIPYFIANYNLGTGKFKSASKIIGCGGGGE